MLDIAIIGAGPAGLSAAINGVIRNKKVIVFGRNPKSSYLYKAEKVDNYLGLPNISGPGMVEQFIKHAQALGVEFHEGRILEVFSMGDYYTLNVENEFYEAKTVIIATGIPKAKYIPGEKELLGKGVSYCGTCDGPLFRGKTTMVIGEIEEAEEDVNFLQEICSKVYFLPTYKEVKNVHPKVEIIEGTPKEILGDSVVSAVRIDDQEIKVDGVFLIKETIPVTQLIKGLEMEDKTIKVNRRLETNFPGVFAAGDCTGRPYQVTKAVGEGAVAALEAVSYLHRMENKNK
ncbi:MAG: thioredoxin reductase [Epulopiscium sp.]|jgi:thioredoxin reductase (NADPH)|uniref:Thioredoxin reductase n=1 Tax=Defluviitalea raffinosedens TaxID=1450156 RepID=A0A7C8LDD4_9FIRM|nr:NAD(P)/FAD-dependent oxidoreductase [Defluviitalea raffinosedens]MBZ4667408.1 Thioredoxin-disulfide reductase [Defluviitaleaceae bacterium]MDK2789492.1 thioredoxin reductase [Candidatus Epulonipiscium sp.]KAE9634477.1 thioredoxin reductase [Defluviitalea raffinosedens]MBM7684728.1 thioredoxin reductase (NADPH) [Defluviitalea raffinosedens]HHW66958.1 NAD(P)/FAD-dependent oxidoreductase [Candidatus Epulonipiscium sp.]